jgi:hypothetical protein
MSCSERAVSGFPFPDDGDARLTDGGLADAEPGMVASCDINPGLVEPLTGVVCDPYTDIEGFPDIRVESLSTYRYVDGVGFFPSLWATGGGEFHFQSEIENCRDEAIYFELSSCSSDHRRDALEHPFGISVAFRMKNGRYFLPAVLNSARKDLLTEDALALGSRLQMRWFARYDVSGLEGKCDQMESIEVELVLPTGAPFGGHGYYESVNSVSSRRVDEFGADHGVVLLKIDLPEEDDGLTLSYFQSWCRRLFE